MRHFCVFIVILAAFSACTGGGKYEEMRQGLQALNALNRADSVLTVTERDEARTLADYFDRHGTPNDQLLAHYLLGRCYADMHEAPMALHCYQEAISRADTTANDCDFVQLSRVYGQSATIFYQQGLYRNQLEYQDLASSYAWRGNDTLATLQCYAIKALALGTVLLEMETLRQEKSRFDQMLKEKEDKIEKQKADIGRYKRLARLEKDRLKHQLYDAPIYQNVSFKAARGMVLTNS